MTASRAAEIAAWRTVRDAVTNHMADRRAEVSEEIGLSFIKAKALCALSIQPMTMGELTATLHTDAPYTSVVVAALVDRRLALRVADPADRRRKTVQLTPAGHDLARVADSILDRPPSGFRGLDDGDLARLTEVFGRLSAGHPDGEKISRG